MKSIDTAELKESADIVSVLESTGSPVQVKGENILCLCPFHNDRHIGSAMFDEKTGYFHCFACGAGGKGNTVDIIRYVQQAMNLDFRGACEFVAESPFSDISQFESESEASDKKFQRMNHKRLKELRLAGEERCEPEFDPKNTQVPDGDIVNFVTTKEEVMEYEKKGYSAQKQWQEIDGTVVLAGWLIYQRVKMSTAKLAMEDPEAFAALCAWKKQELLYEIKEKEKQVEDTVFDRDEYNDLMKILKAREQQVAKL